MPAELEAYIATLNTYKSLAVTKLDEVGVDFFNAGQMTVWPDAKAYLIEGGLDISGGYPSFRINLYYCLEAIRQALSWIDINWSVPITWQSILDAWTYNEYEGAVATVMTMDKMRRIAWDKPFLLDPKWI